MASSSAEARAPRADHTDMANAIRALSMDAVEQARSGHPGMPMGLADVATVLFGRFLKFDPARPDWPDRDRFVLSNGHGSMLLYALLYLTGYPDIDIDEIRNFRQLGSRTAGHPEYGHAAGIETTTGPLGQGLANAVGMALAERSMAARFGGELVDHHTYVVCGDGCLMEGISQEAISLAGHLKLDRLDRALRFQRRLHRRPHQPRLLRRRPRAVRIRRLAHAARGRPRSGGGREGDRCGQGRGPALHDRMPHGDRLRRADEGGDRGEPRRAARRGRDRGHARGAGLAPRALHGAGRDPRCLARRRRAGAGTRARPGRRAMPPSTRAAGASSTPPWRAICRPVSRRRWRR